MTLTPSPHASHLARCAVFGFLYSLAFPSVGWWPLAWVALAPLIYLSYYSATIKQAFVGGWIFGFAANLSIYSWIWKTFAAADVGFPITLSCWVALALVFGFYFGVFATIAFVTHRRFWPTFVTLPLTWALLEGVRTYALTGYPWALLAHSQYKVLPLIQSAYVVGEKGVSFLLVLFNVALVDALRAVQQKDRRAGGRAGLSIGLVGLFLIGGLHRLTTAAPPQATFRVAILQGNIDQYRKWDNAYVESIKQTYEGLALQAALHKPDLILWPESAVPGWIPEDGALLSWLEALIRKTGVPHIVGAVQGEGKQETNAAFLFDAQGKIVNRYDKQHLVPFGEYIPFGGFFRRWIPYLNDLGTFSAGQGPQEFVVDGITISPNICYEAIFSRLIETSCPPQVDIIANLTNDGWFAGTNAPEQHFTSNVFRAIENDRPVIRSDNIGISAVIDSRGRILNQTALLERRVLVVDVPIAER